jgi:hypothetical protein
VFLEDHLGEVGERRIEVATLQVPELQSSITRYGDDDIWILLGTNLKLSFVYKIGGFYIFS